MNWKKRLIIAAAVTAIAGSVLTAEAAEYSDKYTFTLEGATYTLPVSVSELSNAGWTFSSYSGGDALDMSTEVSGLSYDTLTLTKDGKECEAQIINFSADVATLGDSWLTQITVTSDSGISFATAAGIDFTKSYDDVKAVYGDDLYDQGQKLTYSFAELAKEAEAEANGETYLSTFYLSYNPSIGDDWLVFEFSESDYSMTEISMEYVLEPEETTTAAVEETEAALSGTIGGTSTETEAAATGETEAAADAGSTELGTDVYAGIVELNGTVYQLPTTVGDLIAGGFEFELSGDMPGGREDDSIDVYYNNLEAGWIYVTNPNKTATPVEECLVYKLSSDNGTLVLPGGIKVGSTLDELLAAYPELDGMEDGDSIKKGDNRVSVYDYNDSRDYDFSNGTTNYYVSIEVDTQRNVVSEITARMYTY